MKLWDKGISIDKKIEEFTVGKDRESDLKIAKYDLIASRAHVRMLKNVNLLTLNELHQIESGLDQLEAQIENGSFTIEAKNSHIRIPFGIAPTSHLASSRVSASSTSIMRPMSA